MAISDRYFTKIEAKPLPLANCEFLLLGYFDTKEEFAEILTKMGQEVRSVSHIHISIRDVIDEKVIEEIHFPVIGNDKGEFKGEKFEFTDQRENLQFIHKYIDISDHKERIHAKFFAEFIIKSASRRDFIIFSYFNSVNEWMQILLEVGKKITDDGDFAFLIKDLNRHKNIFSTSYKCFASGLLLMPDVDPHEINLKKIEDVKHYAFSLWENEFVETR